MDRISALPDQLPEHILGFLSAEQVVQMSNLGRRCRHLWRSVRSLRFISSKGRLESAIDFNKLVHRLLLNREFNLALDEVEFTGTGYRSWHDNDVINVWIQHALLRRASLLSVRLLIGRRMTLDGTIALASQYLKRLELACVVLQGNSLDFSSCTTLEDIEIAHCGICTDNILSPSVKHLSIIDSGFYWDIQTRISVPNVTLLQLEYFSIEDILLESMPSLETAVVKPRSLRDRCFKGSYGQCCGVCAKCCGDAGYIGRYLHLEALSSAVNLKLIASPSETLFLRNLGWCPTFLKLKTLFLGDWCVTVNLSTLIRLLEHSPVLENLTLQLCKGAKHYAELEGIYGPLEKSAAVSEHLKIVNNLLLVLTIKTWCHGKTAMLDLSLLL